MTTDGLGRFRPGSWRNSWLPSAERRRQLREQWKRVLDIDLLGVAL